MREAGYYNRIGEEQTRCILCPHTCLLNPGETGRCRVRRNVNGRLVSEAYGKVSGFHMDPIEKKPLYHYFPGSRILSVGSYGCNFRCRWCQNASISQHGVRMHAGRQEMTPGEVFNAVRQSDSLGVAFTYNEPTVWFEFMMDTARLVYEAGMKNVVVTNGYINPDPLQELLEVAHAFNVDLKSFSAEFYEKESGGGLQPVKDTLQAIAREGLHLEVTFLVIPGLNDDVDQFDTMVQWIRNALGEEVVLHINRYFPTYRLDNPPTPISLMRQMEGVAERWLDRVYLGNL